MSSWIRLAPAVIALALVAAAQGPSPGLAAAASPPDTAAVSRLLGAALASDHAWSRMVELCDGIGHRFTGTRSLERAVEWARDRMRADGLDSVWLQPVKVPRWVRGRESATILEPGTHEVAMLGLGRSVGTPRGGITADVVVVRDFAELAALPVDRVRGRMVLYDAPFTRYGETVRYRSRGADSAAARGAVAALVRSIGPAGLRTPHTGTTSYGGKWPRIPAAAIAAEDAGRIRRLAGAGHRVRLRLMMEADTLPDGLSHNVIGEIRGRERPGEVVVIGGHLDSWDVGTGAHDDAGGCVISMEALRLIRELGLTPRRTLRCVLWTNEENGTRGARAYADVYGRRDHHVAALESDGGVERPVGFGVKVLKPGSDSTDVAATAEMVERLRPLGRHLAGIGATTIDDQGGGADITPLMQLGVPGFAHRTTMERYFVWHHTAADVLDRVDPLELRRNVAAMAIMAWLLADMEEVPAPSAGAPGGIPAPPVSD